MAKTTNRTNRTKKTSKSKAPKSPKRPVLDIDMYELLESLNVTRPHLKELTEDLRSHKIAEKSKKAEWKRSAYFSHVARLVSFINEVLPPNKISEEDVSAGNYTLNIR